MSKVTVRIDSSRPIFIEADADNFGQVFAAMSDEDQVNVFRAMVDHMKAHPIQWDYISIALEKPENRDVRDRLAVILPDIAAKDAEIAALKAALDTLVNLMTGLVAESGREVGYGEEDSFRMGEWFEAHDLAAIEAARAALKDAVNDQ